MNDIQTLKLALSILHPERKVQVLRPIAGNNKRCKSNTHTHTHTHTQTHIYTQVAGIVSNSSSI